jgi:hypothetical protein
MTFAFPRPAWGPLVAVMFRVLSVGVPKVDDGVRDQTIFGVRSMSAGGREAIAG